MNASSLTVSDLDLADADEPIPISTARAKPPYEPALGDTVFYWTARVLASRTVNETMELVPFVALISAMEPSADPNGPPVALVVLKADEHRVEFRDRVLACDAFEPVAGCWSAPDRSWRPGKYLRKTGSAYEPAPPPKPRHPWIGQEVKFWDHDQLDGVPQPQRPPHGYNGIIQTVATDGLVQLRVEYWDRNRRGWEQITKTARVADEPTLGCISRPVVGAR
jgi:hypothetical protein